ALAGAGADAHNLIANSVKSWIHNSEVVTAPIFDYLSSEQLGGLSPEDVVIIGTIEAGDRVRLVTTGAVYEYIGSSALSGTAEAPVINLGGLNYQDTALWALVTPPASQDV